LRDEKRNRRKEGSLSLVKETWRERERERESEESEGDEDRS